MIHGRSNLAIRLEPAAADVIEVQPIVANGRGVSLPPAAVKVDPVIEAKDDIFKTRLALL